MDGCLSIERAPRISAIKAYILDEIANPDLCLANVAAQQRISSSYVRKLFAAEGTRFTAYVLDIRLENVGRMLTDPETRTASVSAIATMCGFNDVSYFNRAFRKRYGCTPSDLRCGRGASAASPGASEEPRDAQARGLASCTGLAVSGKTGADQR